ncbi:aminoglycoside phosphotransferase family protein [Tropicibacter oceani]|uniref:Aminoglycoside phosphotransferase family protein n=1 Tax=Tropicibacter oceani TaxID=3058420 RepID=A0ABY8QGI0_9RHOB|nr:aminoglycoside phosphotransferase family protein [Tropicibacter oceani]WGW03113.1 aminoglycoside phosphotransferase family protein [Tropicibacter oceani]
MTPQAARDKAGQALRALWPDWSGDLTALAPGVLRASGTAAPVVVKLWPPEAADKARAQSDRQNAVAQVLARGELRAPGVLHFAAEIPALVMHDCGGQPLEAALQSAAPAQALALVERAGAWIAALHASSLRPAPFRPIGHLNWLDKLQTQGAEGTRAIADLPGFARHVAAQHALFDQVRRKPATRAVTHKDLNAGNLLVGADGALWGIDFENAAEDEPLRDLFALGVDILAFTPVGQDPEEALAALAHGYGKGLGDPLVRVFLQRAFALGLWARTPAAPSRRQAARLRAAEWILAQDSAVF